MAGKNGGARPGSGRKPGSGNKLTIALRDHIEQEAIIAFLNDVALGREVTGGYKLSEGDWVSGQQTPTVDQRLNAATVLSKKFLPDMKVTEHSGPNGGPVSMVVIERNVVKPSNS